MLAPEALIFDLDGTLYRQDKLRREMLIRLLRAHALHPSKGLRHARIISAYRRAQEELRASHGAHEDVAEAQLRWACERTKADPQVVRACVRQWIDNDPLLILSRHIQPGLAELLGQCKQRGLPLGLFSDYPADAKLEALGLRGVFDVVLTAQSPEVGAFKPNPRGLLAVAERLGLAPERCAYVGDRAEVDAAAARAAGMPCFILTRRASSDVDPSDWTPIRGFSDLLQLLDTAQPSLNRR